MSVHLIWEGALALIALGLIVGTAALTPHQNLTTAFAQAGYVGLLAAGLSFSFRTNSPNLAAGSILSFTGTMSAYLVTLHQWGKPAAFAVAILLATLIGLILGVLVAVLSVPAWAVTLGAIAVIQAIIFAITRNPFIPIRFTGSYPTALWYGIFFIVSVGGGALWLLPALRRPLSLGRSAGEPGRWTGPRAGLGAIVGLTGSSFLAGLAAVPMLMRVQLAEGSGATLPTVALACVLLGGVSVFGRRAGVFGTLLGVTIVVLLQTLVLYNDGPVWATSLVVGLAALVGLAASRGIESVTDLLNQRRPTRSAGPPPPPMAPPMPAPPPR